MSCGCVSAPPQGSAYDTCKHSGIRTYIHASIDTDQRMCTRERERERERAL